MWRIPREDEWETTDDTPEAWLRRNRNGVLLDIHSFPDDHTWGSDPTTLGNENQDNTEIVFLTPWYSREEANSRLIKAMASEERSMYQGSEVNYIINIPFSPNVGRILIEFNEDQEWDNPNKTGELITGLVNSLVYFCKYT
jgi:hypothetical protein